MSARARLPTVQYLKTLPEAKKFQASLRAQKVILIYDKKLLNFKEAAQWIEQFENAHGVEAGETLKSLASLQQIAPVVLRMMQGQARHKVVLIALGGGSVGDFTGFLSSILKRGVRLVHIPSTWLAAIDSAHGGKTGLNIGEFKNQLGTFKEAERIVVAQELLALQGENEMLAASGELIKMALLGGGSLFAKLEKVSSLTVQNLWPILPLAVKAKYKVVRQDLYEEKGLRHVLNLGHTLGHAFELSERIAHGIAVFEGTKFALRWSEKQKILSARDYARVLKILLRLGPVAQAPHLRSAQLRDLLLHDKKSVGSDRLRFVMLKKVGKPVLKEFSVDDIVTEAVRQGVAQ